MNKIKLFTTIFIVICLINITIAQDPIQGTASTQTQPQIQQNAQSKPHEQSTTTQHTATIVTSPQPTPHTTTTSPTASTTQQHHNTQPNPQSHIQLKPTTNTNTNLNINLNPNNLPQPTIQVSHEQQNKIQQVDQNAQIMPTLTQSQLLSQGNGQQVSFIIDPIKQNIIEQAQQQMQHEQQIKQQQKVHKWVAQQLQHISQADDIRTHQIFAFQVDQQLDFKWNPTQYKSGPLKFVVQVYNYGRGDITYQSNPQQDDYIQILTQSQKSTTFTSLGKVYMKRMFTINFFSDYQIIHIKNNCQRKMLIQISLQATKFVPQKALDDDQLKLPAQKISSILQQLQQTQMKRQKTYRSEWSFRDRQQHHQSEMLILTGVQLFIILATAIVQMYCIKNLFDSRLIV